MASDKMTLLPKDFKYIDNALSMYLLYAQRTKRGLPYLDRARAIIKRMKGNGGHTKFSHHDVGCLILGMLFYVQLIKAKLYQHQSNQVIAKENYKLNYVKNLYTYFMRAFDKTVAPENRKKYNRMLATHAPMSELVKI